MQCNAMPPHCHPPHKKAIVLLVTCYNTNHYNQKQSIRKTQFLPPYITIAPPEAFQQKLVNMSSTTTSVAAIDETPVKPPRKFPPPCWTQDETLVLIEAYRERWYGLRRGYLRTADWDAVAATVADRFSGVNPAKTSAQCRHKMEKLRQRYRAEKQRSISYPYPAGRYFSSWFFFENMDAMENGTAVPVRDPKDSPLRVKLKGKDSSPNLGFYNNEEEEDEINFRLRNPAIGIPMPQLKPKSKNSLPNSYDMHQQGVRFNKSLINSGSHSNEEFWVKFSHNNNNNNIAPGFSDRVKDSRPESNGLKRGRNSVEEMVESIKFLGQGFMKMERAKIEMAREMEMMRMDMEMKRNQMILESQKQIVDAFVKGLFEMKTKNKKKSKKLNTEDGVEDS